MRKSESSKATFIRTTTTVKLNKDDIISYLRQTNKVPAGATVEFRLESKLRDVIGGVSFEIDDDNPIIVTWTIEEARNT